MVERMASLPTMCLPALVAVFAAGVLHAQSPADSARRDSLPATLIGRVVDSASAGVSGAEIGLINSNRLRAVTNDSGQFRIRGLPSGAVIIVVRRLGYQPATFTAVLKPGKVSRANFPLAVIATQLPAVNVADTAPTSHWLDRFETRKATRPGTFFTRADIVRMQARLGTDIVTNVAGVRVGPTRLGQQSVVMTRGAGLRQCIPAIFVHDTQFSGTLDDIPVEDIEAVEVYVGISEIPPELDKGGKGICGAIVVWTRDPRAKS
jgi:hypothetical protein